MAYFEWILPINFLTTTIFKCCVSLDPELYFSGPMYSEVYLLFQFLTHEEPIFFSEFLVVIAAWMTPKVIFLVLFSYHASNQNSELPADHIYL